MLEGECCTEVQATESSCQQLSELQRAVVSSKEFPVGVPHKKKNKKRQRSQCFILNVRECTQVYMGFGLRESDFKLNIVISLLL